MFFCNFVMGAVFELPNKDHTSQYRHKTPRPANCDHSYQILFTTYCQMRRISLPNGTENSYTLRHACFGNSKRLQRHDSVHLSSVYTDYSFSSSLDINSSRFRYAVFKSRLNNIGPVTPIGETGRVRVQGPGRVRSPAAPQRQFLNLYGGVKEGDMSVDCGGPGRALGGPVCDILEQCKCKVLTD